MNRNFVVGFASLNMTVGAVQSNTDKILKAAEEMALQGCHLGIFPEMSIIGYPSEDLVQWNQMIKSQNQQLKRIIEFSENYLSMIIVVGMAARVDGRLYNCAAAIAKGKIIAVVPKEELPTYNVFYEARQYSPGLPGVFFDGEMALTLPDRRFVFGDVVIDAAWYGGEKVDRLETNVGIALTICEDIWSNNGPINRRAHSGANVVVNISASPWRVGVQEQRRPMLKTRSADNECVIIYANQVGANDGLVFDGGGFIYQGGGLVFEAPRFQEGVYVQTVDVAAMEQSRVNNTTWGKDHTEFDRSRTRSGIATIRLESPSSQSASCHPSDVVNTWLATSAVPANNQENVLDEMMEAMILGLNDYYSKVGIFRGVCVALSGGRDSALTSIIVNRWANRLSQKGLPRPRVLLVSMPTQYNSDTTKNIARDLAGALNEEFVEIPIQSAYIMAKKTYHDYFGEPDPLTDQNFQPRIRSEKMWAISGGQKLLWLQCSNMSEKAVGYSTIGGDNEGSLSLLSNVPKSVINEMLAHILSHKTNSEAEAKVLKELIESEASAELKSDQADERDLMPFCVLDLCHYLFVSERKSPQEVYDNLCERWTPEELSMMFHNYKPGMLKQAVSRFFKLFFSSIYKWAQSPPSLHLFSADLERERALQIPVVQSMEWLGVESIVGEC